YCWLTCVLALASVDAGNFGVGSLLIDRAGNVVAHGHNEVFRPYFRSDLHAEMVVMDRFEDAHPQLAEVGEYTLYTSLEPCPMCLVRLISSGLKNVVYAAPDEEGGMTTRLESLPSLWVELSRGKSFKQAGCSEALKEAALEIFLLNLDKRADAIKKRS
ncbi:MAG: nucleoside deaminase, partial [Gammaproteobacteria bacterium]